MPISHAAHRETGMVPRDALPDTAPAPVV